MTGALVTGVGVGHTTREGRMVGTETTGVRVTVLTGGQYGVLTEELPLLVLITGGQYEEPQLLVLLTG